VTPVRIDTPTGTRAPTGTTAAYHVGGSGGLLVDPGARTDRIATAARSASHLAVTHHHPDHVGGVRPLAREFDLTVWVRDGRTGAFSEATGVDPDRTFLPGTKLPAGDGVTVVDTPGHAPEHVAFSTPAGFLSGDLAVAEGSVVVGAPGGDMRAYLSSLRRLRARDPDCLFPAHGPTIDDPRATLDRLLTHRRDRERRVLSAVRTGAETPEAVLESAYEKDLDGVRDLALATVEAYLEKLAVEGRIRRDGDRLCPA